MERKDQATEIPFHMDLTDRRNWDCYSNTEEEGRNFNSPSVKYFLFHLESKIIIELDTSIFPSYIYITALKGIAKGQILLSPSASLAGYIIF